LRREEEASDHELIVNVEVFGNVAASPAGD
jgi:hypothetical protein